jgi:hypothetical protein
VLYFVAALPAKTSTKPFDISRISSSNETHVKPSDLTRPASQPNGVHMTSQRHTEFAPFVLDLLDFMEEKLREAIADDASRSGAVREAAGALPLLRDRLRENEDVQAQFILVFSEYLYGPHAAEWWTVFARMDRPAFEKEADALVSLLAVLRQVAAG